MDSFPKSVFCRHGARADFWSRFLAGKKYAYGENGGVRKKRGGAVFKPFCFGQSKVFLKKVFFKRAAGAVGFFARNVSRISHGGRRAWCLFGAAYSYVVNCKSVFVFGVFLPAPLHVAAGRRMHIRRFGLYLYNKGPCQRTRTFVGGEYSELY